MKVRLYEGPLEMHGRGTAWLCVPLVWHLKPGQGTEPARAAFPCHFLPKPICSLLTEPGNKIRSPGDLGAETEVGDQLNVPVREGKLLSGDLFFCFIFSCSLVPWNVLSSDNAPM